MMYHLIAHVIHKNDNKYDMLAVSNNHKEIITLVLNSKKWVFTVKSNYSLYHMPSNEISLLV